MIIINYLQYCYIGNVCKLYPCSLAWREAVVKFVNQRNVKSLIKNIQIHGNDDHATAYRQ